jgi:hypothetical protein
VKLRTLALAAIPILAGCAGATQNVRAIRAYAHEETSIRVSLDRIEDLAKTLELVDRILFEEGYTPGDTWVRRLPLDDVEAKAIKDDVKTENPYKTGEYEVPILKLYRRHIEHVFDEYKAPPEKPRYPSIVDALQGLVPRATDLKAHFVAHRDATIALATATEEEAHLTEEINGLDEAASTRRRARGDSLKSRPRTTRRSPRKASSSRRRNSSNATHSCSMPTRSSIRPTVRKSRATRSQRCPSRSAWSSRRSRWCRSSSFRRYAHSLRRRAT